MDIEMKNKFLFFIVGIIIFVNISNINVSAQSTSVSTCLLDNSNSSCQEYLSSTCDSQCATPGGCFPGRRADFSACQLGTCFDSNNGLCNSGTPRGLCENRNGIWSTSPPAQCNKECCLVNPDGNGGGDQAQLTTARQCNNLGQTLGAQVSWVSVNSEVECLAKATTQNEGACVLDLDVDTNKYNCKLTTGVTCLNLGGDFYEGWLCTKPELNTKCGRTGNTQCVSGKNGVYFIDSCENRANIYNYDKLNDVPGYWSSIIPVSQSCSLGTSSDPLSKQDKCGNCDYLQGNICGTPQPNVDVSAISGQYVCKDLSCLDGSVKRKHGSSWCVFDSAIGVNGTDGTNEERSVDVPGSRHYKRSCFNGEIRTETCAEYRNEICVEGISNVSSLPAADCKLNTALSCLAQNEDADKLSRCEENSDCFIKRVDIDDFEFDKCVPKYPAGFELQDEPEQDSKDICAIATQTCTFYEQKNFEGRWECKRNCACKGALLTQAMNNLCISLGDCGAEVNLAGNLTKNYISTGAWTPDPGQAYFDELKKYALPVPGQKIVFSDWSVINTIFSITNPARGNAAATWYRIGGTLLGGVGQYRETQVNFECLPWQPPAGGDDCSKCDQVGFTGECSEYKCKSLGKTCEFLNKNSENELCVNNNPNDVSPPVISIDPSVFSTGFSFDPATSGLGVIIKDTSSTDGSIKEYSIVRFGIKLDEPGQCKVSTESTPDYDSMEDFFGNEANGYSFNHNDTEAMPLLTTLGVGGVDPARRGDHNLYIRCQDSGGYSNDQEYVIRFKVSPRNDVQPPIIDEDKFIPVSPGFAGLNADSKDVKFYTDEPATCKYSLQDQSYEIMEYDALCDWDINSETIDGWECSANLNVSQITSTGSYYFRCSDQPWLVDEPVIGKVRNNNSESVDYIIQKTTTALTISSMTLNGTTIYIASEPVPVTLNINTAGGISSGKALCEYNLDNRWSDYFSESDSNTHRQIWSSMQAGQHNVDLECEDVAGNTVTGNVQFNIVIDDTGPLITRVYNSGNSLKVITNERSSCAYSTASCSFDFANGTLLSGLDKSHTTPYNNKLTYRIKCQDTFGNEGTCLNVRGGY